MTDIPEHILVTLDVEGMGHRQQKDGGIVPVFPDELYEAMARTDPDQLADIQAAIQEHCKAYTLELMENAMAPVYGRQWRAAIIASPDRRYMASQLMQTVLKTANLGAYIRKVT